MSLLGLKPRFSCVQVYSPRPMTIPTALIHYYFYYAYFIPMDYFVNGLLCDLGAGPFCATLDNKSYEIVPQSNF